MKTHTKILRSLTILSLLIPAFLRAEDQRIPVGKPAEPIEIISDFDSEESGELKDTTRTGFSYGYPPVYYPASCHWITKVSALGDSLEIEDGSVWELNLQYGYKTLYWQSRNPVMITQNHNWFSKYNYRIMNQQSGEFVEANLKYGPFGQGDYTNFISIIDRQNGTLALTDNSNLEVCFKDLYIFDTWREGQAIIIGVNSGWQSTYDLILINVNMNNFVRAKHF